MHNAVQLVHGAASLAGIAESVVHEPARLRGEERTRRSVVKLPCYTGATPSGSYWLLLALVCNLRGRAPRIHGVVVLHLTFIPE